MKRPEALVILTPAFPGEESATWWVPSQQGMAKALQEQYPGTCIKVLTLLYPAQSGTYRWHNIAVCSFDGMKYRKWKRPLLWRQVWLCLRQFQRTHRLIGLFSFWSGECAFIAQHFGRWHSVRHISWICGQDATRQNRWVRFIRPRGDQLAAMGAFLRDEYQRSHGIYPQHLVPNAIDPRAFPAVPPAIRDIDVMAAGSFEPLKQYGLFATVVASLHQCLPTLKAIHCGLGREQEQVELLLTELQLRDTLTLLGGQPHATVLGMMQRSKVFLHTSRYEGCSTVCLEALYAGAHVISFCYPFDHPVPHWHVVQQPGQMIEKALELLQAPAIDHCPVLCHTMEQSAQRVMQLFTGKTSL